jgi:UDPglucose 6-dehydrogenase
MSKPSSVYVIGSGYVDLLRLFASRKWITRGHRVTCVDNNELKVKALRDGGVPIFERHLPELLAKHLNRAGEFSTDLASSVEKSQWANLSARLMPPTSRSRGRGH